MAVFDIEPHRQKNGMDILKVILNPTRNFPDGYFYADACDEELIRENSWSLQNQKKPYVVAYISGNYHLKFHREKAFNILGYYPECINHINMIEFDNVNLNLDVVSNQQNLWSRPSRGYHLYGRSFRPEIIVNQQHKRTHCVKTELEACIAAYQLELAYEDYRYDFLKDRRKDLNILDKERTGKISEEEAVYLHVLRYVKDNAWYYFRYNLQEYFKNNHIPEPIYDLDSDGFMVHRITGERLCPFK